MGNLNSSTLDKLQQDSTADILSEAETLRNEAQQLMIEAKQISERSQAAYRSDAKEEAKILSNEKAELYRRVNEKNRQASSKIFEYFNRNQPDDHIDLHGLYVKEALDYLRAKIAFCRSKNILKLTVITGAGNHSTDGIAKIKPQVETFARENRLLVTSFRGHVVIELLQQNDPRVKVEQNRNRCIIL